MRLRIRNTVLTLKIIAWWQIIGGILGMAVMAYIMLHTDTVTGPVLLLILIGVGLFGFSIFSGKKIITDIEKSSGIIYSIINQSIQLLQWSVLGYKLVYSSGLQVTIGIQKSSLVFNFNALMSEFSIAIKSDEDFFLRLNISALLLVFVLFNILEEKRKTQATMSIDSSNA
jgi:hypothetical protein